MKRFWFEFEIEDIFKYPHGVGMGCGVTAYNYEDAIMLMKQNVFKAITMPKILNYVENIDISSLDANHVIPNMSPPIWRGIWFPLQG